MCCPFCVYILQVWHLKKQRQQNLLNDLLLTITYRVRLFFIQVHDWSPHHSLYFPFIVHVKFSMDSELERPFNHRLGDAFTVLYNCRMKNKNMLFFLLRQNLHCGGSCGHQIRAATKNYFLYCLISWLLFYIWWIVLSMKCHKIVKNAVRILPHTRGTSSNKLFFLTKYIRYVRTRS